MMDWRRETRLGAGAPRFERAVYLMPLAAASILVLLGLRSSLADYERFVALLGLAVWVLVAGLLLWRQPRWGLAILAPAGLLIPFELPTGTSTGLNPAFLLTPILIGLCVLSWLLGREGLKLPPGRVLTPLALLMLTAVLAFFVGQFPWFPSTPAPLTAQAIGLCLFLFSGGIFFLAAHYLRDPLWLRRTTFLFLAAAAGLVLLRLGLLTEVSAVLVAGGAIGSLFWTWLVAMALGQAAFNRSLGRLVRLALLVLAGTAVWIVAFEGESWVSGWLPALVAATVIGVAVAPKTGGVALTLGAGLAVFKGEWLLSALLEGEERYSLLTRIEAMKALSGLLSANPVLGLGPANYYHYTPLYPILGWHVKFNSHNNYIDILAQTGLIGLVCFFWFVWAVGRMAWGLRRRPLDGFSRGYVYGAIGGLAGTLVAAFLGDWLIPFVYNVGVEGFRSSCLAWLFLGGVAALDLRPARS